MCAHVCMGACVCALYVCIGVHAYVLCVLCVCRYVYGCVKPTGSYSVPVSVDVLFKSKKASGSYRRQVTEAGTTNNPPQLQIRSR